MAPVLCSINEDALFSECRPISLQTPHMIFYPLNYFPPKKLQNDLYHAWSGKRCWPFPMPLVFYPAFREKAAKTRYIFLALPGYYDRESFAELRKSFPPDHSVFYFRHTGVGATAMNESFSYGPLLKAHEEAGLVFDQYTFDAKIRRDAYVPDEYCGDFQLCMWGDIADQEKLEIIPYTKWGVLHGPKKCEIVKMVLSKTTDFSGKNVLFICDVEQMTTTPFESIRNRPPIQNINWHISKPLEECVPTMIATFFVKQCNTYMCKHAFYSKEHKRWIPQFEMFRIKMGEVVSISTGENFGIDHRFLEKGAAEVGLALAEVWAKVPAMSMDLARANVVEGAFDIVVGFTQHNAKYRSYISEHDKMIFLTLAPRVIMFE